MSEPGSIVRVGSVPFDSSYTHTMTFASAAAQASYFSGLCTNVMSGCVFIRPDQGFIRFNSNSNDLYGSNYVMFYNPTNPKWWYGFIIDLEYGNEEMCTIHFQIDVMQTWYFNYTLSQCYIEREHVNNDAVGANLLDEPVSTGELKYAAQDVLSNEAHPSSGLTTLVPVVFTAEEPYSNPVGGYSKRTAQGGWNNAVYSGCGMYVFKSGVLDEVNTFLNMINMSGGGSAVSSVVLFPKALIPDNWPSGTNVFKSFLQAQTKQLEWNPNIGPRNSPDGYIPRNAKLYTYPYNFMRMTNFRGAYHDYRFEFFEDTTQPVFNVRGTPDPGADIMCQPKGYNGVATNVEEQLTLGGLVQCAWTYNSYQNWLAQNAGNNLLNLVSGAAMLVPAAGTVAWGAKAGNAAKLAGASHAKEAVRNQAFAMAPSAGETAAAGAGGGILANLGANVFDASQQPSKAVGTVSNATMAAIGYGTFGAYRMCVRKQFAMLIDQFFDMYGYTVQEVKVPNRTGRACWNYVKTRNASLHGNVPASDMALINAIYDNGITFWHDGDIGNYNRPNPIV